MLLLLLFLSVLQVQAEDVFPHRGELLCPEHLHDLQHGRAAVSMAGRQSACQHMPWFVTHSLTVVVWYRAAHAACATRWVRLGAGWQASWWDPHRLCTMLIQRQSNSHSDSSQSAAVCPDRLCGHYQTTTSVAQQQSVI